MKRWNESAILGTLALINGSVFLERGGTLVFVPPHVFQAGCAFKAGYIIWLGSMLMLVGLSVFMLYRKRRSNPLRVVGASGSVLLPAPPPEGLRPESTVQSERICRFPKSL